MKFPDNKTYELKEVTYDYKVEDLTPTQADLPEYVTSLDMNSIKQVIIDNNRTLDEYSTATYGAMNGMDGRIRILERRPVIITDQDLLDLSRKLDNIK